MRIRCEHGRVPSNLVLQFPFHAQAIQATFSMVLAGGSLVGSPPPGPGDDVVGGVGRGPDQAEEQMTEFGDGERDAVRSLASSPFWVPTASAASARRARVT